MDLFLPRRLLLFAAVAFAALVGLGCPTNASAQATAPSITSPAPSIQPPAADDQATPDGGNGDGDIGIQDLAAPLGAVVAAFATAGAGYWFRGRQYKREEEARDRHAYYEHLLTTASAVIERAAEAHSAFGSSNTLDSLLVLSDFKNHYLLDEYRRTAEETRTKLIALRATAEAVPDPELRGVVIAYVRSAFAVLDEARYDLKDGQRKRAAQAFEALQTTLGSAFREATEARFGPVVPLSHQKKAPDDRP